MHLTIPITPRTLKCTLNYPCTVSLIDPTLVAPRVRLTGAYCRDLVDKPFFPKLLAYMISGPVVCMAWEGKDVVAMGRKMLGATNPLESAPGTIRGDFSLEVGGSGDRRACWCEAARAPAVCLLM